MAAGNQVVLTFAGEEKPLLDSFNRVGDGAREMGRRVEQTGDAFDRAGERADEVDTKAMGFRDTLTGIQDGAAGIKKAAAGDWGFETLLLLGTGVGDLASGLFNFLIPATKAMTAAKWLENTAWLASPITWIIAGILVLVGVIILIATKTDWFSKAWRVAWDWIKKAAGAAWDWIKSKALAVWEWIQGIPGRLKTAFSKVAEIIVAPYRFAFNMIAKLWNNTIGRLSWTVPSWIPGIGGNHIEVPNLPTFHAGGMVPGYPGEAVPIMAQAGEEVSTRGSRGRADIAYVRGDGLVDYLIEAIAGEVRRRGGAPGTLGLAV